MSNHNMYEKAKAYDKILHILKVTDDKLTTVKNAEDIKGIMYDCVYDITQVVEECYYKLE